MNTDASGASAWRRAARISLIFGAASSLAFTLYAGRHQRSMALLAMFVIWVLLPFAGLFASDRRGRTAPATGRISLQIASVMVGACSLLVYGMVALSPPHHNAAFIFIVFPAVSWVVIGAEFLMAWKKSRRS
jgi:hypothetical protein